MPPHTFVRIGRWIATLDNSDPAVQGLPGFPRFSRCSGRPLGRGFADGTKVRFFQGFARNAISGDAAWGGCGGL